MKKFFTLLIFTSILFLSTFAQVSKIVNRVVPLISEQEFYLNSATRIAGKTRTYLKVELPENTISWYYVISTELNQGNQNSLELVSKLTNIIDKTGISETLIQNMFSSTGSSVIDVYLLDNTNIIPFIDKDDNWGSNFSYKLNGTRENFGGGLVSIKASTQKDFYLGFRNTSSMDGKYVRIEAAAIVQEQIIDNTKWTNETKDVVHTLIDESLKEDSLATDVSKSMASCMTDYICMHYTPEYVAELSDYQTDDLVEKVFDNCAEKIGGVHSDKAITYGNLGWQAYENGEVDKCIEYSKKALQLDNSLATFKYNLGLCYLVKENESIAIDYYIEAISMSGKNKLKSLSVEELQGAITDLDNLIKAKKQVDKAKKIKNLLLLELENYK
jgi:tetratricopeptide (TPR) repeat protein